MLGAGVGRSVFAARRFHPGGHPALPKFKLLSVTASRQGLAAVLLGVGLLSGCGAQINRHGHVFIDVDVNSIQPGMTKEQVTGVLGSPDTTSTIAGEAYYYISTTQKTVAFLKAREIDRQVVAVYFNGGANVEHVAHYGLKDGIVVNYLKDETPARGKDLGFIEQIFGNISNRGMFKDQRNSSPVTGAPPI
jgi:outer membrane protein assembly factor BamE (lipoprotein component of BamABCDE complex)